MLCLRGKSDCIYIALFSVILLIKVVALLIVRVSCRREMIHTIAFFLTLNVRQDRAAVLIGQLEIKCSQAKRLLCVALTRKRGAHLVVVSCQLPLWISCLLKCHGNQGSMGCMKQVPSQSNARRGFDQLLHLPCERIL